MPYIDSPHHEIEVLMSFKYLNGFKLNEHTQDYHSRKPNDENFLFGIEDKKYVCDREKVIRFETDDTMLNYFSELCLNDVKFPYAYGENNIYFMLHRKHVPIQEYETSTPIK